MPGENMILEQSSLQVFPKSQQKKKGPRIPLGLQKMFIEFNRDLDKPYVPINQRNPAPTTPPSRNSAAKESEKKSVSVKRSENRNKENPPREVSKPSMPREEPMHATQLDDAQDISRSSSLPAVLPSWSPNLAAIFSSPTMSPQTYLDAVLQERGYSSQTYSCLDSGYLCTPTPLQLVSYGYYVVDLVKNGKEELFGKVIGCGISPNPCNAFGESLLHMVCRQGTSTMVQSMIDAGSNVQVADDAGRTPLHFACWTRSFDVIRLLLNCEKGLFFMKDRNDYTPLNYVRQEHWGEWKSFLHSNLDTWFPANCQKAYQPDLVMVEPFARYIPDPHNALPIKIAKRISSGFMDEKELNQLLFDQETGNYFKEDDSTCTSQTSSMMTSMVGSTLENGGSQEYDYDDDDDDDDSEYDSSDYDSDEYDSDEEDMDHTDHTDDSGVRRLMNQEEMNENALLLEIQRVLNF